MGYFNHLDHNDTGNVCVRVNITQYYGLVHNYSNPVANALDLSRYCAKLSNICPQNYIVLSHGPLARYAKSRVRMRRECRERFPRHRR